MSYNSKDYNEVLFVLYFLNNTLYHKRTDDDGLVWSCIGILMVQMFHTVFIRYIFNDKSVVHFISPAIENTLPSLNEFNIKSSLFCCFCSCGSHCCCYKGNKIHAPLDSIFTWKDTIALLARLKPLAMQKLAFTQSVINIFLYSHTQRHT